MATSIQISGNLQQELIRRKFSDKETYEEIIWGLVDDSRELSEETKKEIAFARTEIKEGKFHSLAEVKTGLGL
jgi:hypothetical protein